MPASPPVESAVPPGANPVLVELTRGPAVESRHRGAAAVVDGRGKLAAAWGDIERPVFPRSAIKPLQALAVIESGAAEAYELSDAELALACASHSGEPKHVDAVVGWLARIGLGVADSSAARTRPIRSRRTRRSGAPARRRRRRTTIARASIRACSAPRATWASRPAAISASSTLPSSAGSGRSARCAASSWQRRRARRTAAVSPRLPCRLARSPSAWRGLPRRRARSRASRCCQARARGGRGAAGHGVGQRTLRHRGDGEERWTHSAQGRC